MPPSVRLLPAGDKALSVELGDSISPEVHRRVRNLALAIQKQGWPGLLDLIPAYRSLLICYEPLQLPLPELRERVASLAQSLEEAALAAPKLVEIPTLYGGEQGPDLEFVAAHNHLTPQEVIGLHTATDYLVYMMGFTPGFPYLGGLSERIATPRLQTPRSLVPAGSVGIAERQTGIYPVASPGGWRIIGQTPVRLFEPRRDPPVQMEPGDYIRFRSITEEAFHEIQRQLQESRYHLTVHPRE